jgi:hypothetical protein
MDKRVQKQIVIGLIFILLIGGAGYGIAEYFFIIEPICFDGIQNGLEEGVDCGLLACGVACEPAILPLNVMSQKLIEVRPGDYDFVAQINNPNSLFGASLVRYSLDLAEGGTILDKNGTFYVLPGQTRFVIVPGILIANGVVDASIDIKEIEWQKVETFDDISFSIQRKSNYVVAGQDGISTEFEAVILNNSDFDFDKVEVGVILFDDNGGIVAVNRTDIRTFLSREERYFKVSWPFELPEIIKQDIEVITNVFENANFIKRYGTQKRFQKYSSRTPLMRV